jgi:hypothetical protein
VPKTEERRDCGEDEEDVDVDVSEILHHPFANSVIDAVTLAIGGIGYVIAPVDKLNQAPGLKLNTGEI